LKEKERVIYVIEEEKKGKSRGEERDTLTLRKEDRFF
jgi:hypothetical protein